MYFYICNIRRYLKKVFNQSQSYKKDNSKMTKGRFTYVGCPIVCYGFSTLKGVCKEERLTSLSTWTIMKITLILIWEINY
jgi:hypothetical protein